MKLEEEFEKFRKAFAHRVRASFLRHDKVKKIISRYGYCSGCHQCIQVKYYEERGVYDLTIFDESRPLQEQQNDPKFRHLSGFSDFDKFLEEMSDPKSSRPLARCEKFESFF